MVEVLNTVARGSRRIAGYIERASEAAILAIADEEVLSEHSRRGYSRQNEYLASSSFSQRGIFAWERGAIERNFPLSPSRILVGAAGGGREAFYLAKRGYDVVAYEPVGSFVESMARAASFGPSFVALQARHEELPFAQDVLESNTLRLVDDYGPFDAGIIGWGSFSHLVSEAGRIHLLSEFARLVSGPILVSFYTRSDELKAGWKHNLRRKLPGFNRDPGASFSSAIGFTYSYTSSEFERLVASSGLQICEVWYSHLNQYTPNADQAEFSFATIARTCPPVAEGTSAEG